MYLILSEHFCSPPGPNAAGSSRNKRTASLRDACTSCLSSATGDLPLTRVPDTPQGLICFLVLSGSDWSKLSNLARKKFDQKHLTQRDGMRKVKRQGQMKDLPVPQRCPKRWDNAFTSHRWIKQAIQHPHAHTCVCLQIISGVLELN